MVFSKKVLKILSNTQQLEKVEAFIMEIFNDLNIEEHLFFKVLICVNEAVVNSISHGNLYHKEKVITIECNYKYDYLNFIIEDEGMGFDFNTIPDPTTEENIKKETGRGIFIIKNITDKMVFRKKGKIIEFRINLNG